MNRTRTTPRRRSRPPLLAALLALVVLGAGLGGLLAKGEPTLADLRRALLEAHTPDAIGRALDALQGRIGREDALKDMGAFGDWLGALPDGRDKHAAVRLRRGWAYVTAKRGADAVPVLKAVLEEEPGSGIARAYLGDAQRQAGDCVTALATLASARKAGYDAPFVREAALSAVLSLRKEQSPRAAAGLPAYAEAAGPYLLATADPDLSLTVARALLEDLAAYDGPTTQRGQAWALAAGELLSGLFQRGVPVEGGAALALATARALDALDAERQGRTPRTDLLEAAYRLGRPPDREGHDLPQVLPLLAEIALAEGRYELAHRLARERLAISESPAARRVLKRLPPDVGD